MTLLREQPRLLRHTLVAGLVLGTALASCAGDEFSAATGDGGGATRSDTTTASSTTGSTGSGGSSGSGGGDDGTGGAVNTYCAVVGDCDDGDACTRDTCTSGVCIHEKIDVDDQDACTIDACDPAVGAMHTPVNADDGDICTVDTCDPVSGVTHSPVPLDDGDPCTADLCDPATGPKHPATPVDDGNQCTVDSCDPVLGIIHTSVVVKDGNPCTWDSCDPVNGIVHTPMSMDDNNACTMDSCDPVTGPKHVPINFDDGNMCTVDTCDPVMGPKHLAISCEDNDVCTNDLCNPLTGCFHPPKFYFAEAFPNNAQNWTLDPEWQIGSATASGGQQRNNPDPALDHTSGNDNGIAGVVIGGNAAKVVHEFSYLTSPAFNTFVAGPVTLEFYRWLNSDHAPYMKNSVEVWDGFGWIVLWESGLAPDVADNAWTKIRFDVTPYKNQNFKIRFGFKVGSSNVYSVSSWNIDDIRVIPGPCP